MTFRKQWPQKRTEYPTSNRAKSQRQYFTAKTTAHARASDIRARHHQSPTTRSYSYRPLRPHNRMISRATSPRPSDPRGPARPGPRRPDAAHLILLWPPAACPCRETGSSRAVPGSRGAASYARRAPPPVPPRYAIECGGSRPRPRGGKAWNAAPAPVMCTPLSSRVQSTPRPRQSPDIPPRTHARRVDRSPAHAC